MKCIPIEYLESINMTACHEFDMLSRNINKAVIGEATRVEMLYAHRTRTIFEPFGAPSSCFFLTFTRCNTDFNIRRCPWLVRDRVFFPCSPQTQMLGENQHSTGGRTGGSRAAIWGIRSRRFQVSYGLCLPVAQVLYAGIQGRDE